MGLCPLTGKDLLNLIFMLVSAVLLVMGTMTSSKGGPNKIFSWHPFCMSLGFGLMITLGFWMFNYEDLPGEWIDSRTGRRKMHAICQLTGISLICFGYFAVYRAHWHTEDAQFFKVTKAPWAFEVGPDWLRLGHIILGYTTLFLLFIQFFLGLLRYRTLTDDTEGNDNHFAIHETIGNLVYGGGIANMLLGVWLWGAWPLPLRAAISLTVVTSAAFGPRWDGSRGFLAEESVKKKKSDGRAIGHGRVNVH
jgi:hypothetical protein